MEKNLQRRAFDFYESVNEVNCGSSHPVDLMRDFSKKESNEIISKFKMCWNLGDVKKLIKELENEYNISR